MSSPHCLNPHCASSPALSTSEKLFKCGPVRRSLCWPCVNVVSIRAFSCFLRRGALLIQTLVKSIVFACSWYLKLFKITFRKKYFEIFWVFFDWRFSLQIQASLVSDLKDIDVRWRANQCWPVGPTSTRCQILPSIGTKSGPCSLRHLYPGLDFTEESVFFSQLHCYTGPFGFPNKINRYQQVYCSHSYTPHISIWCFEMLCLTTFSILWRSKLTFQLADLARHCGWIERQGAADCGRRGKDAPARLTCLVLLQVW